jgi:hypothetical protein
MRKITVSIFVFAVIASATIMTNCAHAGIGEMVAGVKGWFTLEVAAFGLSMLLTLAAGAGGFLYTRIAHTLREAGEFLAVLGEAVEDQKLTREELADILSEGRDIFGIWR